jgi:hypothetical protein
VILNVHAIKYDGKSTIAIGVGTDDGGNEVRFAGDWRPMQDIAEAIQRGEIPEVEVPDWAVLGPLDA